jgi:hypothetical protein
MIDLHAGPIILRLAATAIILSSPKENAGAAKVLRRPDRLAREAPVV